MEVEKKPKQIIKDTINKQKEENAIKGLRKGSRVPNFEITNQEGKTVRLYDKLKENKVILSFYRGDWCGYCKDEMKDLRDNYKKIKELGGDIIAVAPQTPEKAKEYKNELNIPFDLLSDSDLDVTMNYNLVWKIPENIKKIYLEEFDLNIPELNANDSWHLPVPATFILNKNGTILEHYTNLNYSKRMSAKQIIEVLRKNQYSGKEGVQ